jgi:glutathione S-transferase
MELFTARVCPYAHRSRLALLEKGVAFEHIEIDLADKSERFLAVSPYGKVPALFHAGKTIYESVIINEYLDEVFPDPPLMPESYAFRAKARIWTHYCNEYFTPDLYAVIRNREPGKHAELAARAAERLRFVEREAFGKLSGEGPYWFGSQVSLTDLAWYPYFERLPAWTHYRGFDIPDDCPRLAAWAEAMAGRPAVRKIANDAAYYIDSYKRYAGEAMAA